MDCLLVNGLSVVLRPWRARPHNQRSRFEEGKEKMTWYYETHELKESRETAGVKIYFRDKNIFTHFITTYRGSNLLHLSTP
jgi:hypothetical protein